jgi:hypothetical protein
VYQSMYQSTYLRIYVSIYLSIYLIYKCTYVRTYCVLINPHIQRRNVAKASTTGLFCTVQRGETRRELLDIG